MTYCDNKSLGRYVATTRERKKISLPEIKRRGGPSVGWVNSLERGLRHDVPKLDTLKKLAVGLGEPLGDVLAAAGPIGEFYRLEVQRAERAATEANLGGESLPAPTADKVRVRFAGHAGGAEQVALREGQYVEVSGEAARLGDFAVIMDGEGMTRLGILDSDVLIIREGRAIKDGQHVVANLKDGGSIVGRYKKFGAMSFIVPESFSEAYKRRQVDDEVRLVGAVAYAVRYPITFTS